MTGSFESRRISILDGPEKINPAAVGRGRCAGPELNNLLTADGLSTTSVSPSRPVTMLYRNGSRSMRTRTRGIRLYLWGNKSLFTCISIETAMDEYGTVCYFEYIRFVPKVRRGRTRNRPKKTNTKCLLFINPTSPVFDSSVCLYVRISVTVEYGTDRNNVIVKIH